MIFRSFPSFPYWSHCIAAPAYFKILAIHDQIITFRLRNLTDTNFKLPICAKHNFSAFYDSFSWLWVFFLRKTLHCNSRRVENFQNLSPKSVFSSGKPCRCQVLGLDIDFLWFYGNFHVFRWFFKWRHCIVTHAELKIFKIWCENRFSRLKNLAGAKF